MFLAGCDADGSWGDFPLWRENLRFILRLQQTAARLYPCLARPMSFSNSKYNMNATTGSVLVEGGHRGEHRGGGPGTRGSSSGRSWRRPCWRACKKKKRRGVDRPFPVMLKGKGGTAVKKRDTRAILDGLGGVPGGAAAGLRGLDRGLPGPAAELRGRDAPGAAAQAGGTGATLLEVKAFGQEASFDVTWWDKAVGFPLRLCLPAPAVSLFPWGEGGRPAVGDPGLGGWWRRAPWGWRPWRAGGPKAPPPKRWVPIAGGPPRPWKLPASPYTPAPGVEEGAPNPPP